MSDEVLLGLDIGTASTKAVVALPDGTIIARCERPHDVSRPSIGRFEHDAEAVWWQDVRSICAELDLGDELAGVCVSGIGPCVVPCDERLRPLRPAILYGVDTRASAEIDELNHRYGANTLCALSGSVLSSQALGPKLLWLRHHEPDIWTQTRGWFMASSWIVARLTGEYVLDHHSASQCDPLYDLAAGDWAYDLAAEIAPGVPLPDLAWPGEIVGKITPQGADESGLPAGVPVLAGTVDAWAEAFSVGVRDPGDLMLMYGSTMFMIDVVDRPLVNPRLWATAGVRAGSRCLAAGMATSGALTDWLRRLTGDISFSALAREVARVPPGAEGLLILPYFAGERTPVFDPDARGVIVGLTLDHGRGHLMRGIYEAIGFGVRHNLAEFVATAGEPRRAVAVGGGATPVWTQIVSDITGLEQALPRETVGASYGDAQLAAMATGLAPHDADWTTLVGFVRPDERTSSGYDDLYELYLELYMQTADINHRLAAATRPTAAADGRPRLTATQVAANHASRS